jgi:hypothetical protein
VVEVSAQATLDGDTVDEAEQNDGGGLQTGSALILDQAAPDTDWERVCQWVARAQAEGVIRGVDR